MQYLRRIVVVVVLCSFGALALWWWDFRREHRYDPAILDATRRYSGDPALVKAVIWRESRFKARARGRAGEIGLMQVMSPAASEWARAEHVWLFTHERLFDPTENILAGTWYLQKLWKRYQATDNPMPYALADYNAGRSNVLKWTRGAAATNSAVFMNQITFPGTKEYVKTVMKRYEHYHRSFAGAK